MAITPTALGPSVKNTSTSTDTINFTTNVAIPGNCTVIGAVYFRSSSATPTTLASVTAPGLSPVVDVTKAGAVSGGVGIFSAQNVGSAISSGLTLTAVSADVQNRSDMLVWYIPGLASLDAGKASSANGASSTPGAGATGALTGIDEFVLNAIGHFCSGADTAGAVAGWTEILDEMVATGTYIHAIAAWKLSGSVGATPSYAPTVSITSNFAAVQAPYKFGSVSAPTIITAPSAPTGTAMVGQVLTSDGGSWNNGGDTGMTVTYQWKKYNGSSWQSATGSGSTTLSYTIDPTDLGLQLRLDSTAINSAASGGVVSSSAPSAVVVAIPVTGTVVITPNTPVENAVLAGITSTTVKVSVVASPGNVVGGTVTVNGGTPLNLNFNAASGLWQKSVAVPLGSIQLVYTFTDDLGDTATVAVNLSNSSSLSTPPTVTITAPDEGATLVTSGVLVQTSVGSDLGIAATDVSVDQGVTWQPMVLGTIGGGTE